MCIGRDSTMHTQTQPTRKETDKTRGKLYECSLTPQPLLLSFSLCTDEDGLLLGGTGGKLRDEELRDEDNELSIS